MSRLNTVKRVVLDAFFNSFVRTGVVFVALGTRPADINSRDESKTRIVHWSDSLNSPSFVVDLLEWIVPELRTDVKCVLYYLPESGCAPLYPAGSPFDAR